MRKSKGVSKLALEGFRILVVQVIQRIITNLGRGGEGPSEVEIRFKGNFLDGR
jgi:hypothetical protein